MLESIKWIPQLQVASYNKVHYSNCLLGFLKRNLPKNNSCQTIREHSYRQLILPTLNYCATIWDPHHHNAINQIKMIQHHAARFVLNCPWCRYHHNSITHMLTELQWPTLQTLRTDARFILLYKLIHHHQLILNQ